MKSILTLLSIVFFTYSSLAQVKNIYSISFYNVAHHEAEVTVKFTNIQPGNVSLQMAKRSPGSYGVYEFAKNIYNLKITDGSRNKLKFTKTGLNQWNIEKHKGEINVSYTVFADKGDRIFSKFSEDQTIVNNPATFIYIQALSSRPIEVTYANRSDLNWNIATQLKPLNGSGTYYASNLEEFMDSPTLLADFTTKEKKFDTGKNDFKLKLAIKHNDSDNLVESLFNKTVSVIQKQKEIFGGYPNFENNFYEFMASFDSMSSTDIVAHKNSSLITNSASISKIEVVNAVRMFSKTFFQSWNKTRIRPVSLQPFNLQENTLTKEYWFTDGFSSYYSLLTLCRAGVISQDKFLEELSYIINSVVSSPALQFNNVNEISEKALFYNGLSKYSDPQNIPNTVISSDQHGTVLALILDLSLRDKDDLNLDDFMKLFWTKYGKTGIGFTVENIYTTLREYAGDSFADDFFEDYINDPQTFEFQSLLESVGVNMTPLEIPYLGANVVFNDNDLAIIAKYTMKNTPAYISGLEKEDAIISINNQSFSDINQYHNVIARNKIGKKVDIKYSRNGVERNTTVKLIENPNIILSSMLKMGTKVAERRRNWLGKAN